MDGPMCKIQKVLCVRLPRVHLPFAYPPHGLDFELKYTKAQQDVGTISKI